MTTVVQVALTLALLAIVVFLACVLPLAFRASRRVARLADAAERMRDDVQRLVQDSRELVRQATEVCIRTGEQLDDGRAVVQAGRRRTEKADRLVEGVGSVVEPPVFFAARTMNRCRAGLGAFLGALFRPRERNKSANRNNEYQGEKEHV
jgi:hypothetical protein